MTEQTLPEGWNQDRVRRLLDHFESQTDDEEAAEIEAAWESPDATFIQVPNELVPAIRALIAQYESIHVS